MEGQGRLQSRNVKISSQGFSRKILRKNVDRKATESGGGGKHSYYPIFLHFNYSEICHSISRRMLRQRQRVGSRDRFLLGRILLPVPPAITIKKKNLLCNDRHEFRFHPKLTPLFAGDFFQNPVGLVPFTMGTDRFTSMAKRWQDTCSSSVMGQAALSPYFFVIQLQMEPILHRMLSHSSITGAGACCLKYI